MPPRKRQSKQQPITASNFQPLLQRPLEQLGKQVNIPGSYWQGRMSEDERKTLYKCTVRDFTLSHRFPSKVAPEAAFQLQEMGVSGTGSTEQGDASGEIFWIPYVPTFLQYFYETFPEMLPQPKDKAAGTGADVPQTSTGDAKDARAAEQEQDAVEKPDVHPAYPHVRLSRSPVMGYFAIVSDVLVEMGPKCGQYKAKFECLVTGCGTTVEITHKQGRACSTTNLIGHLRRAAVTCSAHKAALAEHEAASSNYVDIDGENVPVHNFSEAFPCATHPTTSPTR